MYERFTDRARKVMQLANQAAQRINHLYIGTEHILLGLIEEDSGVAANVLKNLDVDLRKVRLEVEKLVISGPKEVTFGKLPQTPRTKNVIQYAMEESRNLGHNYVGTEHLLLGLLREQEGVAAQVLMNLGLKLEEVRKEVMTLLGDSPGFEENVERQCGKVDLNLIAQVPRLTKIVEYAMEEARDMHQDLGGEHVLLGLFHDPESIAAQVLKHFGLKVDEVREEILRRIGENK
jgi:ATP-dependent Clp protease ATP-binding subunit ClpA